MKTQNVLYIAVLAILILVSVTLLAFYYTQDVEETIEIKSSLNYNEITIQTDTWGNDKTVYLQSAKAKIGSITVENNGIFTHVYNPDVFLGCINFVNNPNVNRGFFISPNNDNKQVVYDYYYDDYGYQNLKYEIPVNDKKVIELNGAYNSQVKLSEFSKSNIKSVSVYKVNQKEMNPFSEGDYNTNYYSYGTVYCDRLEADKKPFKVISII